MNREVSKSLFDEAQRVLVGGVDSPVRAFKSVGGDPVFFAKGEGAKVYSEDGDAFVDYVLSWGPLILGHCEPRVVKSVCDAAQLGLTFGAPHQLETKLGTLVRECFPSMEKVRFVNSGTEAAMSAIRLARGVTGRDLIIKFDGCYHGHSDGLLVATGSGGLTLGVPDSAGVPDGVAELTVSLPFNDEQAIKKAFEEYSDRIAGVILEPVCGNMGVILPRDGYLDLLRSLCDAHGSMLIFDEVMCGFRLPGFGAQQCFGVTPDITVLGKVVGGGLPCAAYGARAEIMDQVAPLGPVYQAGTLSGNPLAMAAGIVTLEMLMEDGVFDRILSVGSQLSDGIQSCVDRLGLDVTVVSLGTMFSVFLGSGPFDSLADVKRLDGELFAKFYRLMLDQGVYLAPSCFEAGFVSLAHTSEDIDFTVKAFDSVLKQVF